MLVKFLAAFVTIILIIILTIAPIGYHQAYLSIFLRVGSLTALQTLTRQSLIVGFFALIVGLITSVVVTNSISRPVNEIIRTLDEIQQGNINRRATVFSSDETASLTIRINQFLDELQNSRTELENRVEERTADLVRKTTQLQAASQVARDATKLEDLNTLLSQTVNLVSDRFDFYHTGIFLLDDTGRYAVLQAASSEGGRHMLSRGHRLEVGQQGIVGSAAYQNRPVVAMDVGAEINFFKNPDLPMTHSEAAFPLTAHGRVIGVLDIQSTKESAFTQEDLEIFQTLADQIGLAIQNARLYTDSQMALQRLEAVTAENVLKTWSEQTGDE